jgi:ATP-dependent HslUV protease subunit HslV
MVPPEDMPVRTHSTTILAVRRANQVVIAGDGQVTLGNTVIKHTARKVRRIEEGKVIGGFAGSAADGIALFERLEGKLREHGGNLTRAAVEMAKDWRTDRVLRRLEAMLVVADRQQTYLLSGTGDVIQPDDGIIGIGSGGSYALAAARALALHSDLSARAIAEAAMEIAAEICLYTNHSVTIETLEAEGQGS